jgi:hypothetical protein
MTISKLISKFNLLLFGSKKFKRTRLIKLGMVRRRKIRFATKYGRVTFYAKVRKKRKRAYAYA